MKRIFTFSLFAFAFSFAPMVQAVPAYLYFDVEAFDWNGWKYFDYARIGVADDVGVIGYLSNLVGDETSAFVESGDDRSSAIGWADISDYVDDKDVWFFAQAYDAKKGEFVWDYDENAENKTTYADLVKGNHIATSTTDPEYVTPWVVPEPTCALLLLLGLAGLALKRKRKFLAFSLLAFAFPLFSFGAADDTLISFSTKGPDTYLDGTTVRDGECYALIWTRHGATFEGLVANGVAVGTNSQVLVFAPVAKGGHCPPVLFELNADLGRRLADGSYGVYLVDTRLASGAIGGVNAQGQPVAVNGWGRVDGKSEKGKSAGEDSAVDLPPTTSASIAITCKSALPADAPKPQITAIRLVGDNVFLTVKNTLPCLQYAAKGVEMGGEGGGNASCSSPVQGSESGEITIIAPKKGASGFYSVDRN